MPMMEMLQGIEPMQPMGMLDAIAAINAASFDSAVKYIFLKPDAVTGGIAQIEEFRKALENFRSQGKAVVSYIENPTNGGYYLASVSDKIYMTPHDGGLNALNGISSQMIFLKDILDRMGVNVQLIRHGKFKSAGEMFVRNSSSKENMQQNQELISSMWESWCDKIAQARGLEPEEINTMLDNLELNFPSDFLDKGLVDELLTREELQQKLCDLYSAEKFEDIKAIQLPDYAKAKATVNLKADKKVAVIYAEGNIIDGKYFLGGTQQNTTNVFADMYAAGRSKWTSRQFQFDTGVDIDLKKVLKGLKFKTNFAMDYATSYSTSYDNTYAVYTPLWSNYNGKDVIVGLTKEGLDEKSGNQNIGGSDADMTVLFNAMFDYNRTFAQKHNVSAMLIAAGFQQTLAGNYHRISNANLGVQATYNYDQRYYVDFSGALVHSAKFAPGHRNAFSPSVTLGWNIANEGALRDSEAVNHLSLSVSGSILNQDIDIADYYLYAPIWKTDNYGYEWNDGNLSQYVTSTRGQNDLLTFIQRKEVSANIKGAFFNNSLTFDASYFIQSMEGYPVTTTTTWPSHLSTGYPSQSFIPTLNYNKNARTGFDVSVNYNKTFGDFAFSLGLNATWYDTIASLRDEVYDDYRQREGKPLDGIWGYRSAGLFQSQEEIDAWPEQKLGSTVRPGDIRYVDQNGDNVINTDDQVFLGKGGWYGNPLTLGANLTLKYKGFSLFVLATAGTGAYGLKNSSYYWIDGEDKYSAVVRDRWTPETAATATYPRLTVSEGANNFVNSDFWMYSTKRFDLAKVQLTYTLPSKVLANNKVFKGFSAYVSGSNLLTVSPERKHMEMNVGSAPQTRFYNLGVKLVF